MDNVEKNASHKVTPSANEIIDLIYKTQIFFSGWWLQYIAIQPVFVRK